MDVNYQVCTHCVMDTTDSNLTFDENGVCDRCREYEQHILPWWNHGKGHEVELKAILEQVRISGKGKKIRLHFRTEWWVRQLLHVTSCSQRVGTSSLCISY